MDKQQLEIFNQYLLSKERRGGIKTHDGHAVIPNEALKAIDIEEDKFKFKDLVTVIEVNRTEGKQPVLNIKGETLQQVDELLEEPLLPIKPFTPVAYKVKTYRGYVLVSQELSDDGVDTVNDTKKAINKTVINTENKSIYDTLNSIKETAVSTEDNLRSLLEEFSNTEQVKFYVSQEAYNKFDKEGLIKQSSKHEDGIILGKEVVNIEAKGNVAFIGNLKELIFFDRSVNTAEYMQHAHYGLSLNVAARHDVKLLKGNEIKKVSFNLA